MHKVQAMKSNRPVSRVLFFYGAVILCAAILGGKLFFVQVVHGADYRQKAERQYVIPQGSSFDRGSVFFQSKDGTLFSAATMRSGFTLAIKPSLLANPEEAYTALSKIVIIDKEAFLTKAAKKDDPYEEVAKELTPEQGSEIQKLGISGVILAPTKWRFYPAGETAAQTLGFVGYKDNILSGQYGLERYYDDALGRNDPSLRVNFFAELFGDVESKKYGDDTDLEGDIVTYIEPNVETFLEEQLKKLTAEWHPKLAGGIIIDPHTGAVYAMASSPTFDLNNYGKQTDPHIYVNPLVEDVFEMGSIVKALTMAAGLDAKVVTPESTYNDKGTLLINSKRINNWDGRGRGPGTTMQTVLNESLNTGAVYVEQQLGNDRFREYMEKYGIGEETGIDLPNESAGLVSNLQSPRDVEYATASFGQGIAISPIEITRALSVLANGGLLVTPQVVKEIHYEDGTIKPIAPYPTQRVLQKETSQQITRMLVTVVDKALANGTVALPHYSVAAKTGTAQIADKVNGGYYPDKYLHSFFGYFPAYGPKFLIFYFIVDPQGASYASQTITSTFIDTVKFLINYYNIPPDR
jgi:cell division protein FtsI/penicillin-binding protein 2